MSSRLLQWVLVIAFLVAPQAAGRALGLTTEPQAALGLLLLQGVVLAVAGLAGRVWRKWEERLADRLDEGLLRLLSGYGRRYRRHLWHRHQYFDVKGLSFQGPYNLGLNQVFVELGVGAQPPHQASADPLRQTNLRGLPDPVGLPATGRHAIWAFLGGRAAGGHNLVVIGPPGSGKTTLLKHIALTLARRSRFQRDGVVSRWKRDLPILLFLRDHAQAIQDKSDYTLPQAIQDSLARWGPAAPPGWFESRLTNGRCP